MYESYYGLRDKPFRLRPDPTFFYGSKGHRRAMSYLEYGLSQGEGFIVVTGEVGAGKTTLVRKLFNALDPDKIVTAHLANTHLGPEDTLKMVAAAFGLPFEDASKAALLIKLEAFFQECDRNGQRPLLVVDEAQNLTPKTLEELRMLSNFQVDDKPLAQIFLLGQPEFRQMLHSDSMEQLRQRVTASYHLGPMDAEETRIYIEHRLRTVGWQNAPSFSPEAFASIYGHTGGIPRSINTLCDRLLLMGYLEELHVFGATEVEEVIHDIEAEFALPGVEIDPETQSELAAITSQHAADEIQKLRERLNRFEKTLESILKVLRHISSSSIRNLPTDKE